MTLQLFEEAITRGAEFSQCGKYRYALWRIWDASKPIVMFIGLNPSNANSKDDDPTIESVIRIARHNGFGGFYMMNCFPFVTPYPKNLHTGNVEINQLWIDKVSKQCKEVVFAWGNFSVVEKLGQGAWMRSKFPNAKALKMNKNGTPKHPLYTKEQTPLINYTHEKSRSNH